MLRGKYRSKVLAEVAGRRRLPEMKRGGKALEMSVSMAKDTKAEQCWISDDGVGGVAGMI